MSTTVDSDLDWHGEGVTIAEVLGALNTVRRKFALLDAADDSHPHSRNCVMTLVAIAADEAEEKRALDAVMDIASHHPSLAIVVRDQPNISAGKIDATVSAHPVHGMTDVAMPCELVTLHVHGTAGAHLAALVDPMLVSGVPTYMWWLGTPPFHTGELNDAVRISDALVVDSARFARPYHSFLGLSELTQHAHHRLGFSDFQWARLGPWRETIAQFFAPDERRPLLAGISEIGIDYAGVGRGNRIGAALLIGWLGSALGWKLDRAAAGSGGLVTALFKAEGWRPLQVTFRSVPRTHIPEGALSSVRINGGVGGKSYSLAIHRDPQRARPADPSEFQRLHPTGGEDDAALEIAQRRAQRHREVVVQNLEALHHTATGNPPGESIPPHPRVIVSERRRADTSDVLLTMIDMGDAQTLRHIQRVPALDESMMLINVLSTGAHDDVYNRSLAAAALLMRAL